MISIDCNPIGFWAGTTAEAAADLLHLRPEAPADYVEEQLRVIEECAGNARKNL